MTPQIPVLPKQTSTYICRMRILQPLRVLWKLWLFLLFSIMMIGLYPVFLLLFTSRKGYWLAFKVMQFWSQVLIFGSGIILRVDREAPLPEQPFIICPNHSSYLDIIIMYQLFRKYFIFMGKAEINNWPLFNIFFTKGMNISVDRNKKKGAHEAYERAKEEVKMGNSVVIFPEGTIPPTAPYMRPFKNGAFKLSLETGVPIVPVTFLTNWKRLQAGPTLRQRGGPGWSRIVVHPPVYPEEYKESGPNQMKRDIFAIIEKPILKRYGDQRPTD